MSQVIIDAINRIDVKSQKWTETSRRNLREFLGIKPGEEIRDSALPLFENGNDANAFNYDLALDKAKVRFGQLIRSPHPPTEHVPYLMFEIEESKNPEHAAGAYFSDSYRTTAVKFSLRLHLLDSHPIDMQSQNLGFCNRDRWGNEDSFTKYGREFMNQLLPVLGKLLDLDGLRQEEKPLLEQIIGYTDKKFKEGTLQSGDWYHT